MSRARHKERASGGRLSSEPKWNAGEDQNAAKEAMERKKGGKADRWCGRSSHLVTGFSSKAGDPIIYEIVPDRISL